MNLPGSAVSAAAVTEHDRAEVARVVALGVEFLGVSFVRKPEDIQDVRRIIPKSVKLIAKIEKDAALANLDGILEASDAMMVARGDLGVELPFEQVPLVQKKLIQRANRHGKPVITATQMLESMVSHPRPTRAEASDVANAILDGTGCRDALRRDSGGRVCAGGRARDGSHRAREVEAHRHRPTEGERRRRQFPAPHYGRTKAGETPTEDAIAVAVSAAADLLSASAIVCFTSSGFTARTVSSYRPRVPILALTPEPETFRQLGLAWGVVPILYAAPQALRSDVGDRADGNSRARPREGRGAHRRDVWRAVRHSRHDEPAQGRDPLAHAPHPPRHGDFDGSPPDRVRVCRLPVQRSARSADADRCPHRVRGHATPDRHPSRIAAAIAAQQDPPDRCGAVYRIKHADHVHGIDDLRSFSILRGEALPLYGPHDTMEHLRTTFRYIFDERIVPLDGTSKPSTPEPEHTAGKAWSRRSPAWTCSPLPFEHGRMPVFGYRIGPVGVCHRHQACLGRGARRAAWREGAGAQRAVVARTSHASFDPRSDRGCTVDWCRTHLPYASDP